MSFLFLASTNSSTPNSPIPNSTSLPSSNSHECYGPFLIGTAYSKHHPARVTFDYDPFGLDVPWREAVATASNCCMMNRTDSFQLGLSHFNPVLSSWPSLANAAISTSPRDDTPRAVAFVLITFYHSALAHNVIANILGTGRP